MQNSTVATSSPIAVISLNTLRFVFLGLVVAILLGVGIFYITKRIIPPNLKLRLSNQLNRAWKFTSRLKWLSQYKYKETFYSGIQRLFKFIKLIPDSFKYIVVNVLPLRFFLYVAGVLPIGGWLEYRERDITGKNALLEALSDKDLDTVDAILKVMPKPALYRFYLEQDIIFNDVICYVSERVIADTPLLVKLLQAVEPEKRLWLLKSTKPVVSSSYVHSLADDPLEKINAVLELLPEQDRFEFINIINEYGNTPIMSQANGLLDYKCVEALLKYCPKEKLISYLNTINKNGETLLMRFAGVLAYEPLRYILKLIPADQLEGFLNFHDQGKKAILAAHLRGKNKKKVIATKAVLEEYGLTVPPAFEDFTEEDGEQIDKIWQASEKFKETYGDYPLNILGMPQMEYDVDKIKKAYRKKMLQFHPDKNNQPDANSQASSIGAAYEFFTKPEERAKYLRQ